MPAAERVAVACPAYRPYSDPWHDRLVPLPTIPGLRGGVAVALAISMVGDLDGSDSARAIMSVTLGLAAFTVFFLGGLSHDLVEKARRLGRGGSGWKRGGSADEGGREDSITCHA